MEAIKQTLLGMFCLCIISSSAFASHLHDGQQVRVNRYTLVDSTPTLGQLNLMSVMIDVTFSQEVKTVGQAIQKLLSVHGFKLGEIHAGSYSQYVLFLLPLPEVHRQIGPLRLETALKVLGGDGFELKVNPITREVNFRLRDAYDTMLTTDDVIKAKKRWDEHVGVVLQPQVSKALCNASEHEHSGNTLFGPIESGDYLSNIALLTKVQSASVEQAMMSIFDLNTSAFVGQNINRLKRGVMLRLPGPNDMLAVDLKDAKLRVRKHYQDWLEFQSAFHE